MLSEPRNTSIQRFKLWQRIRRRIFILISIISFSFLVLFIRLFSIQVVSGYDYFERSQRVVQKVIPIVAPRGEMYDRYYTNRSTANTIVTNRATLNLVVVPSHFRKKNLLAKTKELEQILELPAGTLQQELIKQNYLQNKNEKIVLIKNLQEKEHTILADYTLQFSNFIVEQNVERYYTMGPASAHIAGYTGSPSLDDIRKRNIKNYQTVGKTGLELYYDTILRGVDGEVVQLQTAKGRIEEQKVFKNFQQGNNLILTVDAKMQQIAYNSVGDRIGAVVVLSPANGEILTLLSKPDYDPNILASPNKEARNEHLALIKSSLGELNRVISSKYPPASTFKTLVALAGLEEGRVEETQSFACTGKFILPSTYKFVPDTTFFCWDTHHSLTLVEAINNSCSSYFYQLGLKIGSNPIIKYARYFRLQEKTGIDIPSEINGFVPTPLWKEKYKNQRWFDGDTINLSVGQGFIETTVLGMANAYATLAANGIMYKPHFIKEIRYADTDVVKEVIRPEVLTELPLSQTNLEIIRRGLQGVTEHGTARYAFRNLTDIVGKTGTVQVHSEKRFDKNQHAWFIGYGPITEPLDKMIVVAVFIEKGQAGAASAAPVAADIFSYWKEQFKKN